MSGKKQEGNKRKRPRVNPSRVIQAPSASTKAKHFFSVSFQFITHDFDCHRFSAKKLESLLERLHSLSMMEWDQIYTADKHGFGSEYIKESQLNFNVPTSLDEDHSGRPISLRCGVGNMAMVGKRVGDVFQLLCVECEYGDAYDHGGS